EEINMYEDMPQSVVSDIFQELLYGDTPYGWTIAGPKENIKNMKIEDFLNYRKSHYVVGKTLIVVAGDVNEVDAFKKIEKSFSGISKGAILKKKKLIEKQDQPQIKIKFR